MEDFSDEQLHELVWMPAHGSAGTIGSATMSNGEKVGPLHWRANRLVDLLAKSAARPLRVHCKVRKLIQTASHALEYSLAKLGVVTHAANNFETTVVLPDGHRSTQTLRDSAGMKAPHSRTSGMKRERVQDTTIHENVARSTLCVRVDVVVGVSSVAKRRKSAVRIKEAALEYEADYERRFMESWKTGHTPLRPNDHRPAPQRFADVRARVLNKANPDARDFQML